MSNHPFTFREGSYDREVFEAVVGRNEYRLPDAFRPDDRVVDVGTHIGSFSYAAAVRGSRHVHTFEPFRENFECARRNLAGVADQVSLRLGAVWRSDRAGDALFFHEHRPDNKAAGHVLYPEGDRVEAIALDDVLLEVTDDGRERVRFLKIDCEGSEYPILLTAKRLDLVDEIAGEYHNFTTEHAPTHPFYRIADKARVPGYDRYTVDELSAKLRAVGFDVTAETHPTIPTLAGWFFAVRPARPASRPFWRGLLGRVRKPPVPARR